MKLAHSLFFFLVLFMCNESCAQVVNNRGNVFAHAGTIAFYSTYSIGYESPDILFKNDRHHFMVNGSFGQWNANLFNKNTGIQSKIGLTYLRGAGAHHFEMSAGATFHYDRSLDKSQYLYIATLPIFYVGYRFKKPEKRFFLKAGLGFFELLQIGFGFKI